MSGSPSASRPPAQPDPAAAAREAEPEHDDAGYLVRGAQPTRVEAFVDAAFAFAVTLLVISVGSIPSSVDELINAMRGVPAFAASFITIALIWLEHRQWSQRFGLEDNHTIRLSLALVFVVLLYVYPLRMMFTLALGGMSGGVLASHPVVLNGIGDIRVLYVIFAIGYAVVALIIAQLNRYALRCGERLALTLRERQYTRTVIEIWWMIAGIALLSLLLAVTLPLAWRDGVLTGVPGYVYVLIWPGSMIVVRRGRKRLAVTERDPA